MAVLGGLLVGAALIVLTVGRAMAAPRGAKAVGAA
jgi:hypothetical protein